MAGYCSALRLFYWLLLAFLALGAFAAPGQEWIGWVFVISILVILLMVDAMFFSSPADFAFDPNVRGLATSPAKLPHSLLLTTPHPILHLLRSSKTTPATSKGLRAEKKAISAL